MSGDQDKPPEQRGVLTGAFQLLDALVELSEGGLTAVAAASGLPKATAHRLLRQLCEMGAVERRGSRYRMGHRMFQLGQAWHPYPGLEEAADQPIRALATASGADVAVCVLRGGQTVFIGGVPGELGAVNPSAVGVAIPGRTAAGKILVATSRTATMLTLASASWTREREAIHERGVAFDHGEVVAGVCCVAVPVHGGDGEPVAALAAITAHGARLPQLAQGLRRTSDAIAATLRAGCAL